MDYASRDREAAARAVSEHEAAMYAGVTVRALGLGPGWAGPRMAGDSKVRVSSGTEGTERIEVVELLHGRPSTGPLLKVATRSLSGLYPPAGLDVLEKGLAGGAAVARGTVQILIDGQPVSVAVVWDGFTQIAVADLADCTLRVWAVRNWPPVQGLELVTITDLGPYLAGRRAARADPGLR